MFMTSFTFLFRRLLVATGVFALVCVSQASAQSFDLPDLGNSSDAMMSTGAEVRLGRAFMRSVRAALPVLDDPILTSYLESLGNDLVAADRHATGDFTFFLIDEPVVNAFAGPGGYIGVYAGLILAAETESELAAVIAHEIAHVTQRHLMRGFEDQQKISIPATALLVAAAILGAQVSSDAGMAAIMGIQAAAIQRQINFTRDNENEADRLGIATLAHAGHDPHAMAGFFGRLARSSRLYENHAPEFLRTHPVNSNRIADALARADEFGARQRPDSLRFQLARANLRERSYARAEQSVAHFRDTLREGRHRNETAERYGYALALERARDVAGAQAETAKLLAAHPSLAEFIVLDARLDLQRGQTERALNHLKQASGLYSDSWPLRIAYAEALISSGKPARALDELIAVERLRPGNAMLYALLEQAAMKAGNKAATHRFRAEKLYAEGDIEPAIRQLEIALRQRDMAYHDAARIQARLDLWKEEERERKRREKGLLGERDKS
ncbi:peptidase M48 [Thiocystis minor]|nr:peptidase M48 [Thiocystis minor]